MADKRVYVVKVTERVTYTTRYCVLAEDCDEAEKQVREEQYFDQWPSVELDREVWEVIDVSPLTPR